MIPRHLDDQPITPFYGPLVVVADDEVVQRRRGGPHLKRTWWTEESIGTASGCGYKQEQMANSCCPLSCQGPEDLSAQLYTAALSVTQTTSLRQPSLAVPCAGAWTLRFLLGSLLKKFISSYNTLQYHTERRLNYVDSFGGDLG